MSTENPRRRLRIQDVVHTWHGGDARKTIARLKANLNKIEDEASRSDATPTSAQQLLEHINKSMQDFRTNVAFVDIVELQEHHGQTGK